MSPSATTTSVPSSPSYSPATNPERAIKPNPHPYAIKTTSTGLLTRSNSTSQNTQASHHYYVPPSPTQITSLEAKKKSHRLSKSLNNDPFPVPRPLPTPPGHVTTSQTAPVDSFFRDDWSTPRRSKRVDSFPSIPSAEVTPVKLEDLPSNPKVWTPSQLSSYLTTALRVRSGEILSLPLPVARDVAGFVKESKINGRLFLRLCEQDLEAMGVNKLWKNALLASSRDLRQNVLKGRIWGTGPGDERLPFSSELYNSSSSSVDLPLSAPLPIRSEDESVDRGRRPRRYRNGRVRGMVESFERSGSFSSDGNLSDVGIDVGAANRHVDEEAIVLSPIDVDDSSHSPAVSSAGSLPVKRPLPKPPVHPSLRDFPEEEPTVEELLEAEGGVVALKEESWGARAWEEMDRSAGITVKKFIRNGEQSGSDYGMNTIVESKSGGSNGSNKSRDERRIVTSIFSPSQVGADVAQRERKEQQVEENEDVLLKLKEQELEEQVKSTNALLETFKTRLEKVERKVLEMEEAEEQLQQELSRRDRENEALKGMLRENELIIVKASSSSDGDKSKSVGRKKKPLDNLDPQSMSALSQYVLLVGLGVCAVVLRVVLRKVVGRNLKP